MITNLELRHRWRLRLGALILFGLVFVSPFPVSLLPGILVLFLLTRVGPVLVLPMRGMSMWPAIGTRTYGLLLALPHDRGDVVMAFAAGQEQPVVKRVVGLGGDEVVRAGCRITVNGVPWEGLDVLQSEADHVIRFVVPADAVFLLGDHPASMDSRAYGFVPRRDVIGRFVPLWRGPAPDPVDLDPADAEDLAALGEHGALVQEAIDRHCPQGHLRLVLRRQLKVAGLHDRVDALELRAIDTAVVEDEAMWVKFLVVDRLARAGDPVDVIDAFLRRVKRDPTLWRASYDFLDTIRQLRASALARLGRYEEALAACEDLPDANGPRISALVGLGRLDDAEVVLDGIDDWGASCWDPYYRAYVACGRGELAEADRLLRAALDAGFPDPGLAGRTPHLAALRDWREEASG